MRKILFFCLCILLGKPAFAENYLIEGHQESRIEYRMVQTVHAGKSIDALMLTYVLPASFTSPTYRQTILSTDLHFFPEPFKKVARIDRRGNQVVEAAWKAPPPTIRVTTRLASLNRVNLAQLKISAPFPPGALSEDVRLYLKSTPQVEADNPSIRVKAMELTRQAETQFDAVQQILTWLLDHMQYISTPTDYTALYALQTGKGNCQNYAHLSAALMRAVGIPARIVTGIVLEKPYDIRVTESILTLKMAQGRHSWIEVFFPELGWIPFDPASTELFVSNRFIRVETGLDTQDATKDGLVSWSAENGSSDTPRQIENIQAHFATDTVDLSAERTDYGPRKMLLSPPVAAKFAKTKLSHHKPPPVTTATPALEHLRFVEPLTFGNLEFPAGVNFMTAQWAVRKGKSGTMEMRRNFLVETAEYVTTKGRQYAQVFLLEQPIMLKQIGIALHSFGGDGQLWLEIYKDNTGKPGTYLATSDMHDVRRIHTGPGYKWHDFSFTGSQILLSPGRYWFALGFTGSPIVNWFFSYGKPVGPQNGTRYRTLFDRDWSRSLAYEFNYRISGLAGK